MNRIETRNFLPLPWLTTMTRILVMSKLWKIQRGKIRTARGRGSATLESSVKRAYVRSTNKHHSQLSTTLASSTN